MSVKHLSLSGRLMAADSRLICATEAFLQRYRGRTVIFCMLAAFVVLWALFHIFSHASVDIHYDLSEASVWAEHLAFGYKHPPMTAWVFYLWFSLFPHAEWAAYLLAVTSSAVTLAVTWRLLRDYLDEDRALLGIAALILVPLFTFQSARYNANTVMMPFWTASLLFYLRARRNLRATDALLAGLFVGLTFLGKYWAIYLVAGIAIASIVGPETGRFWRSPAPYLIGLSAAIVIAPHAYWFLTDHSNVARSFVSVNVMTPDPPGAALKRSISYLFEAVAYVTMPLLFLALLRPSRAVLADIVWPADRDRRQALLLLLIPLILPAFGNLLFPHRLTGLWTYPNWALLPVVLFGSPLLGVGRAAARACLFALAFSLIAVTISPGLAYLHVKPTLGRHEEHFRRVAGLIRDLSSPSLHLIVGTDEIITGLAFYLPGTRIIYFTGLRPNNPAYRNTEEVAIICLSTDKLCRDNSAQLEDNSTRSTDVTLTRSFLGRTGAPMSYHIAVVHAVFLPELSPAR